MKGAKERDQKAAEKEMLERMGKLKASQDDEESEDDEGGKDLLGDEENEDVIF